MSRRICFDKWSFDPDTLELRNDNVSHSLEPLIGRLLEFLLAHPDEVLTHDRLIEAVWDGRVVSDEAVRRAVSMLRHSFGHEDADGCTEGFLHTIHKKGYIARFPLQVMVVLDRRTSAAEPAKPGDAS